MTEQEFQKLIDKYLQDGASPAEKKLIEDFFQAQENKNVFSHEHNIQRPMWQAIRAHIKKQEVDTTHKQAATGHRVPRTLWVACGILCVIVLSFTGVYYYNHHKTEKESLQWLTTTCQRGQKMTLTLSDGSVVKLNSATTISYPAAFNTHRRQVKLQGEAFFEIIKETDRPFIVQTGNVVTRVMGTSFNVQAFPEESIRITVETGKVSVENMHDSIPQKDPSSNVSSNHVLLSPSEQAVYDPHSNKITTATVNLEQFLAWRHSTLQFQNTSMEEVARVLERWYDVSIQFRHDHIKACKVNGQYEKQTIQNVLESIQYMYGIQYKFIDARKIELHGRGC